MYICLDGVDGSWVGWGERIRRVALSTVDVDGVRVWRGSCGWVCWRRSRPPLAADNWLSLWSVGLSVIAFVPFLVGLLLAIPLNPNRTPTVLLPYLACG